MTYVLTYTLGGSLTRYLRPPLDAAQYPQDTDFPRQTPPGASADAGRVQQENGSDTGRGDRRIRRRPQRSWDRASVKPALSGFQALGGRGRVSRPHRHVCLETLNTLNTVPAPDVPRGHGNLNCQFICDRLCSA